MPDLIDDPFSVRATLHSVTSPTFDWSAVSRRMMAERLQREQRRSHARRPLLAAALVLMAFGTLITCTPALMARVETGCLAALHALGVGRALPPVPASVRRASRPKEIGLTDAQNLANFTLVMPSGLPHDVTGRKTFIEPVSVWSQTTHSWATHGESFIFRYYRSNGRSFDAIVERYRPSDFPAPRYIYDADAAALSGATIASVRHENFEWRSGDEAIGILTSSAIDAAEIERIRLAMKGTPLPRRDLANTHAHPDHAQVLIVPAPAR